MKNISRYFAVGLVLVFLFVATIAYVEPPALLFEHVCNRSPGWSGVEIKGELHTFSGKKENTREFTLSIAKPGMLRVDYADGLNAIKNQARNNTAYEEMPDYRKAAFELLLYSDQKIKLINLLKSWIIDTSATHMGLLEKEPCIIVGAAEIQTTTPQVWFSKNRYWPTRLILKDYEGENENIIDIRMSGWNLPIGAETMPSVIDIFVNGVMVESWKVKSMNSRLGVDRRFEI